MNQRQIYPVMTILLFLAGAISAIAQPGPGHNLAAVAVPVGDFQPRMYVCFKTDGYMRVDGKIDEDYWKKAPWTDDYRDISDGGKKPQNRARSKMLWDESYLYIATEIESKDIWAKSLVRDEVLYLENAWEIFIDPDGSSHDYMELQVNAFGTEWDLRLDKPYRDGGRGDSEWNIKGLQSLPQIYGTLNRPGDRDDKWTIEVAIPWVQMPDSGIVTVPPADGDQWRINMARVEWPLKVENNRYVKVDKDQNKQQIRPQIATWSPQGLFNLHYPEQWGIVQFSDSLAGRIHLRPEKRESDRLRWALRQIYYAQRNKFAAENRFVPVEELVVKVPKGNFEWPPQIQLTDSTFTADLKLKNSNKVWRINHFGKIQPLH